MVDLIKVDIEGHEDSFFEGSIKFILKHKPFILFEINKEFYTSRNIFDFDNLFFKPILCNYNSYTAVPEESRLNL